MEPSLLSPDAINKGGVIVLLVAIVVYFHRRDVRNEASANARHKACEDRNTALESRVSMLEDRQFKELKALAEDGILGLKHSTHALSKFFSVEEITPPDSFPTVPRKT